jgi:endoribonuclease Dicer
MPNLDPNSRSYNVTPKFEKLVQILSCFESQAEAFRGAILGEKLTEIPSSYNL